MPSDWQGRNLVHTACRRGGRSEWTDRFGGKPCHTGRDSPGMRESEDDARVARFGTGRGYHRHCSPPFQAVRNCELCRHEWRPGRLVHTACRRGGSVQVDSCFGGKPCHTRMRLTRHDENQGTSSCGTVWNGTGFTTGTAHHRSKPCGSASGLSSVRRPHLVHTACRRGGSVQVDNRFGGKPCHTRRDSPGMTESENDARVARFGTGRSNHRQMLTTVPSREEVRVVLVETGHGQSATAQKKSPPPGSAARRDLNATCFSDRPNGSHWPSGAS